MSLMNNFSNFKRERGVVILFAVLMVSVVLTVSMVLLNISYRQLVLSSVARESAFAFFAADSARNCAKYWDSDLRAPAERPFGYYEYEPSNGQGNEWSFQGVSLPDMPIECGGQEASTVSTVNGLGAQFTRIFRVHYQITTSEGVRDACANVTVVKNQVPQTGNTIDKTTTITVQGYNRGDLTSCPALGPVARIVERSLVSVTQ